MSIPTGKEADLPEAGASSATGSTTEHPRLDIKEAEKKYNLTVRRRGRARCDLSYLFQRCWQHGCKPHGRRRGDVPEGEAAGGGGATGLRRQEDAKGRYRFQRVYSGENWNPQLRAPLTQPGVNVKAGEYLLAVNGRDVRPPENIYSFFEGLAD